MLNVIKKRLFKCTVILALACGPFSTASLAAGGSCGNSLLSPGEQCDDGNTENGDGCSDTCLVEQTDWVCTDPDTTEAEALNNPSGDAIIEGSFEDSRGRASTAWTETSFGPQEFDLLCSEVTCPNIGSAFTSDGVFAVVFRSTDSSSFTDRMISQTLVIPQTATQLNFDLNVSSCETPTDFFEVIIDGNSVYERHCDSLTSGYESQSANIAPFADGLEHQLSVRTAMSPPGTGEVRISVDNMSIPLPSPAVPVASECRQLNSACTLDESFDAGIPADWTVVNLGQNTSEGWGTTDDGDCLSRNAAGLPGMSNQNLGNNLTTGANGALCADSDASGQNAEDAVPGSATEMDTYVCSPALDFSTIADAELTFNAYYQSRNNALSDNGTPDDTSDDFDDDFLQVLVGNFPPNFLTLESYTPVLNVDDHTDDDLLLTGAQELSVSLVGTALEAAAEGYVCFHYRGTFAWFAQIDNAAIRGTDCSSTMVGNDADFDGVFDTTDNCTHVSNPDQIDTNGDGIGNRCDPDIDNNCIVAFIDFAQFPPRFDSGLGDPNYNENFDFDSNGSINFLDYLTMIQYFGQPPGPSANECVPGLGD